MDMTKLWAMQIDSMVKEATEHFPHDARIPILADMLCKDITNTRAWDTLYWLSKGMTEPIFPGA